MLVQVGTALLNIGGIESMVIGASTDGKHKYQLTLKFTCGLTKKHMTYTHRNNDYNIASALSKQVMVQIQSQDKSFVDKAFEDSFLKEP